MKDKDHKDRDQDMDKGKQTEDKGNMGTEREKAVEAREPISQDIYNGTPVKQRAGRFQRAIAIAVPVMLALALAVVCIWASQEKKAAEAKTQALETMVQAGYRQAYYELSDNVNDIQTALKKLQVTASSSRHVLLLSDVWRLSGAAVANMGSVPNSHVDTAELNSFLIRAGDYAHVLTQRILSGSVLSQEDYDQLDSLYEASVKIGNEIAQRISSDDFPIQTLDAEGYYTAVGQGGQDQGNQQTGQQTASAGEQGGEGGQSAEGAGGQAAEDEDSISDYPTLIYDGPFSESNETAEPRGLSQGEVDEEAAKQAALSYLGGGELTGTGIEEGIIPVYGFYGTDGTGRAVEITVSRQGGAVLWMMAETPAGADGVPEEDTVTRMREAAKAYLDQRGYPGMEATYAQFYDGVGVFNFAATKDDVILYNDLVKVYVERATFTVCGVDANNFLMMHTLRTLPQPALTQEEAAQRVSDSLEVASVRLALVPKTAATEVLCYEFKGTCRGTEFIVYINALSGAEEDIFEIINSEDGQLVV